ncbi:MAG: carboxypeptidase regulatory-like domain-containing protein [Planctomycetes bacterium]|nr:carboxypeptidase regulatory-like domain-containing protein [Planctomycetota bacterium]
MVSAPIWKRPSAYVVVCAAAVITAFVASGDLRVETDPARRSKGAAAGPRIVRNHLPAPRREVGQVSLSGRVFDTLGFAVSGAEVLGSAGESTLTAGDGRFELAVADGPYSEIMIKARGYGASSLRASSAATGPLVVRLEPQRPWDVAAVPSLPEPTLTGEGTVRDNDGRPVEGAYVTAAGTGLWSRTDGIGRYTLGLFDSTPTLLVHRPATEDGPSLAARSPRLDLGRARGHVPLPELIAEEGAVIRGTLRDDAGSPMVGVPVEIEGEGMTHLCESDGGGRFHVGGLVQGDYSVRPMAWNGLLGSRRHVVLAEPLAELELTMEPLRASRLQVRDEGGQPVGKAYVTISVDGVRRTFSQADEAGWTDVRLASGEMQFEVRAADGEDELAVRRIDRDQAQLIVAAP